MAKEPEWTLKLEECGTHKEIDDIDYAHKKRSALHQEIARRGQEMRRQRRHQMQVEITPAWRDAERYLKENQKEIQYAARQIIDLDRPQRTYRASREKCHPNMPIAEYMEWGKGKPFREKTNTDREEDTQTSKNTELCAH